jgi:WS/DGAT/MGAT family acyltransferase
MGEGLARFWWRALAACLGVQIAQALGLVLAVRVFFQADRASVPPTGGGRLVDVMVGCCPPARHPDSDRPAGLGGRHPGPRLGATAAGGRAGLAGPGGRAGAGPPRRARAEPAAAGRGWPAARAAAHGPLWVDAPSFDLADHVRVHPLAAPGDQAQLLQACQELSRRLDPARPLWELWLLPGLPQRRVGALLRLHHTIADGAAGVAAFGALLDLTADAPTPVAPPWTPTPIPSVGELLGDNLRRRRQELSHGCSGLVHPGRTLREARRALPAWREVLTDKPAPRTSLNRPVGTNRRLAIVRGRLDLTKQIAHAHHAKVNDVVLAAVAGGLRQLLARRGEDVRGLVQRAMVTISLHDEQPGQAQGNKPGWMMVPLPLGEPDPVRRLELIAAETAARKDKPRPEAGSGIFRFMAFQRVWYRLFRGSGR